MKIFNIILFLLLFFFTLPLAAETLSVELRSGFNFISLPLDTEGKLTTTELFANSSSIEQVFRFDNTNQNFIFQLRLETGNLFGNEFSMTAGEGYVIRSKSSTAVEVIGTAESGVDTRQTTRGFNFIGYAPLLVNPDTTSLFNTHPELQSIFRWNPDKSAFDFVIRLDSGSTFGGNFTLSAGEACFFNFSTPGSLTFGERINTGLITLNGSVELPVSSSLTADSLKVLSIEEEKTLAADSSFTISTIDSSRAPQVTMLTDSSDNPVMLGYELPGTAYASPQLSNSPVRRAAGTGGVINARTTALAICMINPLLLNTSNTQKAEVVQKILTIPAFTQLVTLVESEISSHPSTYLDVDQRDGGIYDQAIAITIEALQSFGVATASSAPFPSRFLERGVLFGVDTESVNDLTGVLRIANWKTTQLVANLYRKTETGWQILKEDSTVITGLGGILDKFIKVKLTLWPIEKWRSELFAAGAPNTVDFKGTTVDLRRGNYKLVLYDTFYNDILENETYYHAAVLNSIDLSFMVVSLFLDIKGFSPSQDSHFKTLLKAIFFNDTSMKNLLNLVRTKFRSIKDNIQSGDTQKLITDILSIIIEGDAIGIAIKVGLNRAANFAHAKFIKMGSKVIFKSIAKKIGPGLILTGYDVANLFTFFADWVRTPNKRVYYLLDRYVWQTPRELDHISLYPESTRTILPGQRFDVNSVGVVAHFSDGEYQGVTTGYEWAITSGETQLEPLSFGALVYTAPDQDAYEAVCTVTYNLNGRTESAELTIRTDASLSVYPKRLIADRTRVEMLPGSSFDLLDLNFKILYSNGTVEVIDDVSLLSFEIEDGKGSLTDSSVFHAMNEAGGATIRIRYVENNVFKNCMVEMAVIPTPVVSSVTIPPLRVPIKVLDGNVWKTEAISYRNLTFLANCSGAPARAMPAGIKSWKIISGPGTIWNSTTAAGIDRLFQASEVGDTLLEIQYYGTGIFSGIEGTTTAKIQVLPGLDAVSLQNNGPLVTAHLYVGDNNFIDSTAHNRNGFFRSYIYNNPASTDPVLLGRSLSNDRVVFEDLTSEKNTVDPGRFQISGSGDQLVCLTPGHCTIRITITRDFGIFGRQETSKDYSFNIGPKRVIDGLQFSTPSITDLRIGFKDVNLQKLGPSIVWKEDPTSPIQNFPTPVKDYVTWQLLDGQAQIAADGFTLQGLHPGTPDQPSIARVQCSMDTFGVHLVSPVHELPIRPEYLSARAVPEEFTLYGGDQLDINAAVDIHLSVSHGFPDEIIPSDYWFVSSGSGIVKDSRVYVAPLDPYENYAFLTNVNTDLYGLSTVRITIHLPAPEIVEGGSLTFVESPLAITGRTNLKFIQVFYRNPAGESKRVGGASAEMDFATDYLRWDNWLNNPTVSVDGDGLYWGYDLSSGLAEILKIAPETVPNQQAGYDAAIQTLTGGIGKSDFILVKFYQNGTVAYGTLEVQLN